MLSRTIYKTKVSAASVRPLLNSSLDDVRCNNFLFFVGFFPLVFIHGKVKKCKIVSIKEKPLKATLAIIKTINEQKEKYEK